MTTAILITCFQVGPDQDERFLNAGKQANDLLCSRGGYRSTRLHKALTGQGHRSMRRRR